MPADLSIDAIQQLMRNSDELRRKEPMRGRVIEAIVTGLQMMVDGRGLEMGPEAYSKLLERASQSFHNDPFFHAIAQSTFGQIMQDIAIGEECPGHT